MVVAGVEVEVEDVFDELLDVLELEDEDPLPLAQGFQTVTVQPPLEELLVEVDEPVLPLLVLDVDVDEDADDVEALAGTIQSGPVLPFALHEEVSLIMSRYSAAFAIFSAKRHRQDPNKERNDKRLISLLDFILKPPCKMSG